MTQYLESMLGFAKLNLMTEGKQGMLELNQRWVHFYGVTLQSAPDDAPRFELERCLKVLKNNFKGGKLHKLINFNTACVRISELLINSKSRRASFLFQYSDSKISDPAFSELASGVLRSEPKLEGEGVAVSAHAIIYLDPIKPGGLEYLMLLEDSPGIGKTKLTPFLNGFLKSLLTTDFENMEGVRLQCYPYINFDHLASQSLLDDLENGELRFIELIKNQTILELDEEPFLDKTTQTVRVKATPKTKGQPAVDFINKVKNLGKEKGYQDMRIVFKKDEGNQRSVRLSTLREDAGDALFGRMEIIETEYDLPQCTATIDKAFLAKMRELNK